MRDEKGGSPIALESCSEMRDEGNPFLKVKERAAPSIIPGLKNVLKKEPVLDRVSSEVTGS